MDTKSHYERLLLDVLESANNPDLAYQSRARLRRALLALRRGPKGSLVIPPVVQSPSVAGIVERIERKVLTLSQPSESLDLQWRSEWNAVSSDINQLRQAIAATRPRDMTE